MVVFIFFIQILIEHFLKKNVENLIRCPRKSLNELMSSRLFFRSSFHSLHQIDSAKRHQFSHYIIGNKLKPYNKREFVN